MPGRAHHSQSTPNAARFAVPLVVAGVVLAGCGSSGSGSTSQNGSGSLAPTAGASAGASASPTRYVNPANFDLQAHRGGRGETTEESLTGFGKSIKLGVTTLELDIVLTKDNKPIIWHDPTIDPTKCSDTEPLTKGDPQFPYVGKTVHDLSYAQIRTLNCGKKLTAFPDAQVVADNKIALLPDLFALADSLRAKVHYNIETKIEADKPELSATPQQYVDVILGAITAAKKTSEVDIQSFDWRTLPLVHKADPNIPLVALADSTHWTSGSPWIGTVDYDAVHGDLITAATQLGVQVISPDYAAADWPGDDLATSDGLFSNAAFVKRAHAAHLRVLPWTVDDEDAMTAQIDAGADGIITDFPTKLRAIMKSRGMPLPTSYH
ncbi:MAG: glycerophosphodiester phosphodiesterase [Actinomycetota bacterium]|nr:glycerophosphodiester phosphodiesterase [Actinomycetota bacterium]